MSWFAVQYSLIAGAEPFLVLIGQQREKCLEVVIVGVALSEETALSVGSMPSRVSE